MRWLLSTSFTYWLLCTTANAAVHFGVTGVFDEMAMKYFWPAALRMSNDTSATVELLLVVLGPESNADGAKKLEYAIESLKETVAPSPNDSTRLAAEIQRLKGQARFISLWDKAVDRTVRDIYTRNKEERFHLLVLNTPDTALGHTLTPKFGNFIMEEIQRRPYVRIPEVAAALQAYHVTSLSAHGDSSTQQYKHRTSLITHCTLDRLPRLKTQLLSWGGAASVAIYIKPTETIEPVVQLVGELAKSNIPTLQIDIALVYGLYSGKEYPINTVRNIAFLQAQRQATTMVFMVDVDFIPSKGLRVLADSEAVEQLSRQALLVVPAFERIDTDGPVPLTFDELTSEYQSNRTTAFHAATCGMCHQPTNYTRWFEGSANEAARTGLVYQTHFREYYEPYIIVQKNAMRLYDEHFVGYGFNKQLQLLDVAFRVRAFAVLYREFIIAQQHETTDAWKRLMHHQSWYRFHKIASYYIAKDQILQGTYQPYLSRTTKTYLDAQAASAQAKSARSTRKFHI